MFTIDDVISRYTRAQAIADGVLVDVTEFGGERMPEQAGIVWPVAMTAEAFDDLVRWNDSNRALNDEKGRLWDVLMVVAYTIRAARLYPPRPRLSCEVWRVPNRPKCTVPRPVRFEVVAGPGDNVTADNPDPVLTIQFPGQD